ncbi:MAG: hypothetical protein FWD65_02195 [Coriobacteriia bacterium]|nr:hypothetical protein [Coriobacteriia bacterium]
MNLRKNVWASRSPVFLCALVLALLLAGCGRKPLDQQSALDVAQRYVIALSTGDEGKVRQLNFPDYHVSLSEQIQKAFNLPMTDSATFPGEVSVDSIKILSTSQEYLDALNEARPSFLMLGSSQAFVKMQDQAMKKFSAKQAEFLVVTTHEINNSEKKNKAYVTVLDDGKGEWRAAPGIEFLDQ